MQCSNAAAEFICIFTQQTQQAQGKIPANVITFQRPSLVAACKS